MCATKAMEQCSEILKDMLSHADSYPFTVRYDAFRMVKDGLLDPQKACFTKKNH
jgi:hypothetical protein